MKTSIKKFIFEDVSFSDDDSSVDQQIDSMIQRAEMIAIKSAISSASSEEQTVESYGRKSLTKALMSEDSAKLSIDLGSFANEIIRSLMIYEKLVDIPGIIDIPGAIVNRAKNFLMTKYGEKTADEFIKILEEDPFASKVIPDSGVEEDNQQGDHIAVGAISGGSSGG